MDLDVLPAAKQVANHAVLDADLGVGGRHLIVISGIAIPDWKINDDQVHSEECRLRLRVPAGTVEQSTVYTGLAAIANDDTSHVFATDHARLEADESDELVLVTALAVMGEPSTLIRFSYQVVLTTRIVASEISGTITWPTAWFRPSTTTPSAIAGTFSILANLRTTQPSPGPFGGTNETLVSVTPGQIASVEVGDEKCRVSYRITDPPKGRELKVTVEQQGLQAPPGTTIFVRPAQAGGDVLTLSVTEPSRAGVDFEIIGTYIG
ncbi:hypothetical protein [Actinoplanes sp. CA-252034]|uniref:hypothetical protein n=1 Tax=Actinoplanes sp. CA-252034 TaxID=3239906 RepID=UPI003D995BAE